MNCKWGRIQEAIASFKAMADQIDTQNVIKRARLLTDLSGRFDTLIIESEVESLDAYFAMLQATFANPDFQAQQAAQTDSPYQTGSRHYYTIEATYESGS
jgi:hypothetical protein